MTALNQLDRLLNQYDVMALTTRSTLWDTISETAKRTEAEMIELEERISKKRDWLDGNRADPKWQARMDAFVEKDVRLHAQYGETLERYAGRLIGVKWAPYPWADGGRVTEHGEPGTVGRPVATDAESGVRVGGDDPSDGTDEGVARSEPMASKDQSKDKGVLARRFRREPGAGESTGRVRRTVPVGSTPGAA